MIENIFSMGLLQYSLFSDVTVFFWFLFIITIFVYLSTNDIYKTLLGMTGIVGIYFVDMFTIKNSIFILIFIVIAYVIYDKFLNK